MVSVLLNFVLITVKFIGGQLSHSVSVVLDAFHNVTDAATTLMTWLGLKISALGAGEKRSGCILRHADSRKISTRLLTATAPCSRD